MGIAAMPIRNLNKCSLSVLGVSLVSIMNILSCSDRSVDKSARSQEVTLGAKVYSVLCDRLGASALSEDVSGLSYRNICHPQDKTEFADVVNVTLLPSLPDPEALRIRNLGIAKLESLARHRPKLIQAIDFLLSGKTSDLVGKEIPLREGVEIFFKNSLLNWNQQSDTGLSLVHSTKTLGTLFENLSEKPDLTDTLSRVWGRQGYQPFDKSLASLRPLFAYPRLRELTSSLLHVRQNVSEKPYLHQFIELSSGELARQTVPLNSMQQMGTYLVTGTPGKNSRSPFQIATDFLLTQKNDFRLSTKSSPHFVALRDDRGTAIPKGNIPGQPGTVPSPFRDNNNDGLADVDEHGALEANGLFLTPFVTREDSKAVNADSTGKRLGLNEVPLFEYVALDETVLNFALKHLLSTLDVKSYGPSLLLDTVQGATVFLGDRIEGATPVSLDGPGSKVIPVQKVDTTQSPAADLLYFVGTFLGTPERADYLELMQKLISEHEPVVAKLVTQMRSAFTDLDAVYGDKKLPNYDFFWRELSVAFGNVAQEMDSKATGRTLLEDFMLSFSDARVLNYTQQGRNQLLFKDRVTYNPLTVSSFDSANDASRLINVDAQSFKAPFIPVIRTPGIPSDSPDNRSAFHKLLQMVHDTNNVKTCNKKGAKIHVKRPGGFGFEKVTYPPFGNGFDRCEFFEIENLSTYYTRSIIGKAESGAKDPILNKMSEFLEKYLGLSKDKLFEASSGIKGFGNSPSVYAVNRFVFFGAESPFYFRNGSKPADLDPYFDTLNAQTNEFLRDLIDATPSAVCPKDPRTGENICATWEDTLRGRNPQTSFHWEYEGYYDSISPTIEAFYAHGKEPLFLDLVEVLHRHWATPLHGKECEKKGDYITNPRFCAETGLSLLEPFMVRLLDENLIQTLHDFTSALKSIQISSQAFPGRKRDGIEVAASLFRFLVDPSVATELNMLDRKGEKTRILNAESKATKKLTGSDLAYESIMSFWNRFDVSSGFANIPQRRQSLKKVTSFLDAHFLKIDESKGTFQFENRSALALFKLGISFLKDETETRCPSVNQQGYCNAIREAIVDEFHKLLAKPLVALSMEFTENIIARNDTRTEIENFLQHVGNEQSGTETSFHDLLTSVADLMQVFKDKPTVVALTSSISQAAQETDKSGRSPDTISNTFVKLFETYANDKELDPYRALEKVARNAVTQLPGPSAQSETPFEIIRNAFLDVNRVDSSVTLAPLTSQDYKQAIATVSELLISDKRGMEQIYRIIQDKTSR
jgi:hypothetical protein